MAAGPIISSRFPYLPVHLQFGQNEADVEALLDTGFDGDVVIPTSLMEDIDPDGHISWRLADGTQVTAPYYRGNVSVGGMGPLRVVITALGDEVLIGCGVAANFTITLDHGRELTVAP